MSHAAASSLVYTSGGGNFMLRVWLIAGLLILTACNNDGEGLSAEQLQEIGLASLSVQYSAEADDFFVETCDELSSERGVSLYEVRLEPNLTYTITYRPTTLTCQDSNIALAARLFLFDISDNLITETATEEGRFEASLTLEGLPGGSYYLVVAPKQADDRGGYTLRIDLTSR
ncbi:MAG: hypothetical protein AAF708_05700 [Deinococcota bacterium]